MNKMQRIIIGILSILLIILTILVVQEKTILLDEIIYQKIISIRNPFWDFGMKSITRLGNTITVLFIVCLTMIYLTKKEQYLFASNVVITVLSNQVIKRIIQRPRPSHLKLIKQGGYSFPSGHAMIAIGLYGLLLYLVNKKIYNKRKRIILSVLLTGMILGIGISRIYVGVHYPTDVLAGYILSTLILIVNISYWNQYRGN